MRHISNVIILSGLLIYLISIFLLRSLSPYDPTATIPWKGTTLNLIGMFGLTLVLTAMTVSALRSIRRIGFRWSNIFLAVIGVGMALIFVFVNYQAYTVLSNTPLSNKNAKFLEQLESALAKDISLESKAELSLMYARTKYEYEGEKIKHLDSQGNLVEFEPSSEDIETRNLRTELEKMQAWGKIYPLRSAVYWAAVAIASAIIGVMTPLKRPKQTAS